MFKSEFWIVFLLCLLPAGISAQELNCRVQVNTNQIEGTDKAVYETFKNAVTEFMNNRQWSEAPMGKNERIECTLAFIFASRDGDTHTAEMQVMTRRPVYGTNYTTALINARQTIEFTFAENQQLDFNPNSLDNNLTAALACWAYIILAMDFDSFAPFGGTAFIQKAQDIVSTAQGMLGDLWSAHNDDKNLWGWTDALGDENQKPLRMLTYNYHRKGLDVMSQDVEKGRAAVTASFDGLADIKARYPKSPLLSNLSDAKMDEWIQLYSRAGQTEKNKVYDLLTGLWPGQSNKLAAIKE